MKPMMLDLAIRVHFNRRRARLLLVLAAVFGVCFSGHALYRRHALTGRIAAYEADVRRLETERAERERAFQAERTGVGAEELDRTRARARAANRMIAQDLFPWCRLLDALEADFPPALYLTEVRAEDGGRRLRIRGYARSVEPLSGYLRDKESVALFDRIVLRNVEVEPDGDDGIGPPPVRFEIESIVEPRRVFPADPYGNLWRVLAEPVPGSGEGAGHGG